MHINRNWLLIAASVLMLAFLGYPLIKIALPIQLEKPDLVEFIDRGWGFPIGENSKEEILKNLGPPDQVKQEVYDNPYFKQDDIIFTYLYPGLTLIFVQLSQEAGGRILFISLEISSRKWPLKWMQIGSSFDKVTKILGGSFHKIDELSIEYADPLKTQNQVRLTFSEHRLQKVVWYFYTG